MANHSCTCKLYGAWTCFIKLDAGSRIIRTSNSCNKKHYFDWQLMIAMFSQL